MRQIERMQGMIDEVLDFAKGDFVLQKETISIPYFINEIVENFSHDIKARNITIDAEIEYQGELLFDRNRIERGIENIIRNAVQAMSKNGAITLSVSELEKHVDIKITDDGPGISPEIMESLFEAFVTSGKTGGTGLGLAVAHRVIHEHGGKIAVDSEVRKGTSFTISLPKPDMEMENT
jgi:signal transduction histidine kinase